jgi:hypothetical protein
MGTINDNIHVGGHLTADTMTMPASSVTNTSVHANAAIVRSKFAQETLATYPVKLTDLRVWDALQTVLPNPSANDDLGLYGGTFATDSPMIKTYDVKAAGAVTLYARFSVAMPVEYVDGQTVELRLSAGMQTTVADTTATVDVQAYKSDREGGISADLCATAAQSINSLVFDDIDFTITASGLAAGEELDVRIAVAVNDAATVTAVTAAIGAIELRCDIKG